MTAYIPFLRWPGYRITDRSSHEEASAIETLIPDLNDVAIALLHFERSLAAAGRYSESEWEERRARRRAIEKRLPPLPRYDRSLQMQRDMEIARADVVERLAAGILPEALTRRMSAFFARAFVHALSDARSRVRKIAKYSGVSPGVKAALDTFDAAVPAVRDARDSISHAEDRLAGQAHGKPMQLVRADSDFISGTAALLFDNLINDRLILTAGTGQPVEVSITRQTAEHARIMVQATINAFTWDDYPHYTPAQ